MRSIYTTLVYCVCMLLNVTQCMVCLPAYEFRTVYPDRVSNNCAEGLHFDLLAQPSMLLAFYCHVFCTSQCFLSFTSSIFFTIVYKWDIVVVELEICTISFYVLKNSLRENYIRVRFRGMQRRHFGVEMYGRQGGL